MCGFVGFVAPKGVTPARGEEVLRGMSRSLARRGPDDHGTWCAPEVRLHLGFRRLSIIDLSPAGHQPMVSRTGRMVLCFNGEIYNHGELRRDLPDPQALRGHSDSEVLLTACETWGVERTLERLRGMFAFAIFDTQDRRLWLARDRLGIKPLYLHSSGGSLAWASELRAFHEYPHVQRYADVEAVRSFQARLYVPTPRSILSGIEKVRPGELLSFRLGEEGARLERRDRYWRLEEKSLAGLQRARERGPDPSPVVDELHELLRESIALRMIADVPVGAFLSGGVDSSVVVSVMQELSSEPVRTFTISFGDPDYDEGPVAQEISRHLGTRHTSVAFSEQEVMESVPSLAAMSDEPMANPSILPTALISRVARQEVVVALSGDGGDELFGGYNRYIHGAALLRMLWRLPGPARKGVGMALASSAGKGLARLAQSVFRPANVGSQHSVGERMSKIARLARSSSLEDAYDSLLQVGWAAPGSLPPSGALPCHPFDLIQGDLEASMMLQDQLEYLPDDLLAKVDRASMWESLEARVPLLDHRIAEFSWTVPTGMKVRDGVTKYPLRQIARRYLPAEILDRPKMGFTVPVARWLRGGLRGWAQEMVHGLARRDPWYGAGGGMDLSRLWSAFETEGRDEVAQPLWTAAVLEAWLQHWGIELAPPKADPPFIHQGSAGP